MGKYILLHGVECNSYGEILHEWTFVFHEPTASEIQLASAMSIWLNLLLGERERAPHL